MIKIENKDDIVSLYENDENNLGYNGKQLIQLNKDITIPAHTRIELETGLYLTITEAIDECIVGEYILDEESPLYVVGETYSYEYDNEPVKFAIYNSSNKEYTVKAGTAVAFVGQYHICNCTNVINPVEDLKTKLGLYTVFDNGDIKVLSLGETKYYFENVIEPDGTSYIKIVKELEQQSE